MTLEEYSKLATANEILAKKAEYESILRKLEYSQKNNTDTKIFFNYGTNDTEKVQMITTHYGSNYGKPITDLAIKIVKESIEQIEKDFQEL